MCTQQPLELLRLIFGCAMLTMYLMDSRKRNSSLLYTLLPWRQAVEQFHQRQLAMAEASAESEMAPVKRGFTKVGVIVPMVTGFAGFSACLMKIWRNYE